MYNKTAQRTAILSYLKDNKSHPTVIDIHKEVSKKLSTISIATVYNTMDILKKNGLVTELPVHSGDGRRFDSNTVPHDHLICTDCSAVVDIDIGIGIDHSMLLTEEQKRGFNVLGVFTFVYGLCPGCRKMESKPARKKGSF
jgi:Fur family peroxide stress response transcriptional regulator